MDISFVATPNAPAAIGPYSQGVFAGDTLFVSGQIGLDPKTGEFVGPGFEEQAEQVMANLDAIVTAAGLSKTRIVACEVYLADMNDFAAFNRIYGDYFGDHKPARAAVAVKTLPKGALVEVKCTAVR